MKPIPWLHLQHLVYTHWALALLLRHPCLRPSYNSPQQPILCHHNWKPRSWRLSDIEGIDGVAFWICGPKLRQFHRNLQTRMCCSYNFFPSVSINDYCGRKYWNAHWMESDTINGPHVIFAVDCLSMALERILLALRRVTSVKILHGNTSLNRPGRITFNKSDSIQQNNN